MSKNTKIQWCDGTVNPVMACQGCELWPTIGKLNQVIEGVFEAPSAATLSKITHLLKDRLPTDVYHDRNHIACMISAMETTTDSPKIRKAIESAIAKEFTCYAGILNLRHGDDDTQPHKRTNSGYAKKFEIPTLFPGRVAVAASWSDLTGTLRPEKPWMNGLPRMIFISDMGDALSKTVPFDYLHREIIQNVSSKNGSRHLWLWLTKRPRRMAEFSRWLLQQGETWPDNLVAMTSVTSSKTVGRVNELLKVECRWRGLSVEPLSTPVTLPLKGIDWCIVGGASGFYAQPFDIAWAADIVGQCRTAGTAPFVKQLGSNPVHNSTPVPLNDGHGGDWSEWPEALRIREFPYGLARIPGVVRAEDRGTRQNCGNHRFHGVS